VAYDQEQEGAMYRYKSGIVNNFKHMPMIANNPMMTQNILATTPTQAIHHDIMIGFQARICIVQLFVTENLLYPCHPQG
jgi:hypothetical protein